MKVKQIVGEHKKGFRAKKYAKKPVNTIAPKKPEANTIKPGDKVDEDMTATQGKIVANDGKTITVGLPDGTQIQKPIANALGKDPQTGAPVFNVATAQTPATMGQAQQDPAQATAAGQSISVNTGEPVNGETTMGEGGMDELAADLGQIADEEDYDRLYDLLSDNGPIGKYLHSEIEDITGETGLHPKDDFEQIEQMLMARVQSQFGSQHDDEGGETDDSYALASAGFGSDEDYGSYDEHQDIGGDPTDEYIKDIEEPRRARDMREATLADDALLEKMRTIAGLR